MPPQQQQQHLPSWLLPTAPVYLQPTATTDGLCAFFCPPGMASCWAPLPPPRWRGDVHPALYAMQRTPRQPFCAQRPTYCSTSYLHTRPTMPPVVVSTVACLDQTIKSLILNTFRARVREFSLPSQRMATHPRAPTLSLVCLFVAWFPPSSACLCAFSVHPPFPSTPPAFFILSTPLTPFCLFPQFVCLFLLGQ